MTKVSSAVLQQTVRVASPLSAVFVPTGVDDRYEGIQPTGRRASANRGFKKGAARQFWCLFQVFACFLVHQPPDSSTNPPIRPPTPR